MPHTRSRRGIPEVFEFEGVGNQEDITTPLGNPGRVGVGLGEEGAYDAGAILLAQNSVAIFTFTGGEDLVGLLDAVFAANSMGG